MGVCTKERKGVAAEVLMAIPCTNSLGGESEGAQRGTSIKGVGGAGLAGERERRCVLLKIPRCDIDIAVNTCVDVMCVSIIRATTGARPIVGDEGQHGRQRYPQE